MMTIHSTDNDDDGDSSRDLNGDNEDVTTSADDCRASCNMSVAPHATRRHESRYRPSCEDNINNEQTKPLGHLIMTI